MTKFIANLQRCLVLYTIWSSVRSNCVVARGDDAARGHLVRVEKTRKQDLPPDPKYVGTKKAV
jgi:hypothetical protein